MSRKRKWTSDDDVSCSAQEAKRAFEQIQLLPAVLNTLVLGYCDWLITVKQACQIHFPIFVDRVPKIWLTQREDLLIFKGETEEVEEDWSNEISFWKFHLSSKEVKLVALGRDVNVRQVGSGKTFCFPLNDDSCVDSKEEISQNQDFSSLTVFGYPFCGSGILQLHVEEHNRGRFARQFDLRDAGWKKCCVNQQCHLRTMGVMDQLCLPGGLVVVALLGHPLPSTLRSRGRNQIPCSVGLWTRRNKEEEFVWKTVLAVDESRAPQGKKAQCFLSSCTAGILLSQFWRTAKGWFMLLTLIDVSPSVVWKRETTLFIHRETWELNSVYSNANGTQLFVLFKEGISRGSFLLVSLAW